MLGLFMFRDSFANIVMITFTALIMIELLNVYSCVSFSNTISNPSFLITLDPQTNLQNDVDADSFGPGLLHFDNAAARVL